MQGLDSMQGLHAETACRDCMQGLHAETAECMHEIDEKDGLLDRDNPVVGGHYKQRGSSPHMFKFASKSSYFLYSYNLSGYIWWKIRVVLLI